MVGKSTLGRSLTGRARYPATPNSTIPDMTSAVITGRRINPSVMFIAPLFRQMAVSRRRRAVRRNAIPRRPVGTRAKKSPTHIVTGSAGVWGFPGPLLQILEDFLARDDPLTESAN